MRKILKILIKVSYFTNYFYRAMEIVLLILIKVIETVGFLIISNLIL